MSATITHIATTPIRVPLARVYKGSTYHMTHRSTLIVRVHGEDGMIGEAYAGDEDATLLEIERIVHEEIAPRLMGEDALCTERCWELARPATFDILRDRRLGLVACAGVDAAIWDLVGKACGQPLWRLWGGYRPRIPMIAIGGYYAPDANLPAEIDNLKELGLAGMKLKVGGQSPEADADRFRIARQAGGADFLLAADANQAWTADEATRFAQLIEEHDPLWFEEPCRWDNDRRTMGDVRARTKVRTCAGQSEYTAAGCRDLIADRAIDICNFDSSRSGGPTEWRRVAAIAHAYGVKMGHHEEPQVAAHLLASIPHGTVAECFHPDRDPIWWSLITNRLPLDDGCLELTDAPGLGWELDLDYIAHHRLGSGGETHLG
jgi:D-galactarolactone cycloisomerase